MKVILRADVDNLGRLGDQVAVKPGYARNYLIPQGLAMPFSASAEKQFQTERKKLEAKMDSIRAAAKGLASKIEAEPVVIEVRVGEGDKLYGSVTAAMIADALEARGIDFDKRRIVLEQPIRALGEYELSVKLHPDVKAELKLHVVKQGGSEEPAEAAAEVEAEPAPEEAE